VHGIALGQSPEVTFCPLGFKLQQEILQEVRQGEGMMEPFSG